MIRTLVIFTWVIASISLLFVMSGHRVAKADNEEKIEVKVVYDIEKGAARRRAVIVGSDKFNVGELRTIGLNFVNDTRAYLGELLIGISEQDLLRATRTTIPAAESEPTFSDTLSQLKSGDMLVRSPIARVLKVGDSALLSVRDAGLPEKGNAGVHHFVIAGKNDASAVVARQKTFRFLSFGIIPNRVQRGLSLALFMKRESRSSCLECQDLASNFLEATNALDVTVQIRSDAWFASPQFPLVFRFEPDNSPDTYIDALDRVVPPKLDQFYKQDRIICFRAASKVLPRTCEGYGRFDQEP